ncbi:ubiquitin-related domain-containing protein [Kickxella alabastrina]|uniref:ubiquitin-related domain-containing protein n=1 Tax=Kickxella alabastrina TaxID=61397 RepID=UPI00221E471D|nr:ubiquitin-related domain-containing protein [Kickxella alabastrina]KAI7833330.1 ubiquitin-related domain-containing protein [Kickxella alabastrina]
MDNVGNPAEDNNSNNSAAAAAEDNSNSAAAAAANNQDVKDEKPETEHINIKVVAADSSEVMFKIKRKTKLSKLMQAYCSRAGQAFGTVRFLVDGQRINGDNTPEELEMEDGDSIDAMTEQVGGSY